MLLEELAKDLVEVTSSLVGGRTINIMNPEGIIVASTETERIGTFHQGALEAVQTGKPVIIRRDQLDHYPGAKEGYNMPLRVNGSIIGVVGLYGDPPEIQYLAHLLEVYAAKYYQLEAMAHPRLAEGELRSRLLHYLLTPTDSSISSARALMDSLKIRLEFPMTAAIISPCTGTALAVQQERLINRLMERGFLRPDRDIWGTVDDRLVLLHSGDCRTWGKFQPQESEAFFREYRLSLSDPCQSLWEIHSVYEQVSALDMASQASCNDMQQLPSRCRYMLYTTAAGQENFLDGLYQKLQAAFHSSELETVLKTVQTYYDFDRSVSQAAAALFIHKNTLQYRVRRVLEALELTKCTGFQQEYLVRLVLEHYKRKQGLRALK